MKLLRDARGINRTDSTAVSVDSQVGWPVSVASPGAAGTEWPDSAPRLALIARSRYRLI